MEFFSSLRLKTWYTHALRVPHGKNHAYMATLAKDIAHSTARFFAALQPPKMRRCHSRHIRGLCWPSTVACAWYMN